ncbi:hypothetical protein KEM48_008131 [Puccinia striiformis f. sp. tritici PST-130]|nr:hypothetical protein KEM48_008131 [Puccinia striiformis f. sp. tritici PST-130]
MYDQLDKAEAPAIPETYIYLLALQCICNVAEGFAGFTLVQHDEFRHSRSKTASDDSPPQSFILPIDELKAGPNKERIKMTRSMADASWPALLASLNFFVSTNLDEELFTETLSAMQSFTYVCGILDLTTPRDAFLLSFCKFAVPPAIVANLIMEASSATPTKASQSVLNVDSLGLGTAHSPHLLQSAEPFFLTNLLSVAQYLSGVLGSSWYTVFETLQNADYVIAASSRKGQPYPARRQQTTLAAHPMKAGYRPTFKSCSIVLVLWIQNGSAKVITPKTATFDMRRKASGVPNLRNHRPNERSFAIAKLGSVALLNIRRLVSSGSEIAWTPITSHLLAVQRYPEAPSSIRYKRQTSWILEELRQCIIVLAEFARQTEDINIALTSGGLLWQVSDHVQSKTKHRKREVRDGAIQTLFRTIGLYGSSLSSSVWHEILWEVIFPLLDLLSNQIKKTPTQPSGSFDDSVPIDVARQPNGAPISLNAKQLDDSKILALESTGKVVADHFASHILVMPQFSDTWATLIQHLSESFTSDRPSVSQASMKTLSTILNANISGNQNAREIAAAWEVVWSAFVKMSEAIAMTPSESDMYFTQAALEAYIHVLRPLQNTSRLEMDHEGSKPYSKSSPDYRPDIDTLPPVPAAVIATIDRIDHSVPDVSSAVISSTAELSTLAFVSPFEVTDTWSNRPSTISVTYIALFKAIHPRLVSLVDKFCQKSEVFNSGALATVLSSFNTPIRLKYGCPAPAKYGKAPPLWKTASISFLTIIKSCLPSLTNLGKSVAQDAFEAFWKQVVINFSCVLSADCAPELLLDLDQQQAEENFDLAFVASLELDVLPCLGQSRIPDETLRSLGMAVQAASRLYTFDLELENSAQSDMTSAQGAAGLGQISPENCRFIEDFAEQAKDSICGTTADVLRRPRERFIYWCFDLLFLFCTTSTSQIALEAEHKRVASIWLPILLTRCIAAIRAYLVDAPIRGTVPFDRLRDEEITYILRQLLTHDLWGGSLGMSVSETNTSPTSEKNPTMQTETPNAHLLYLQPLLVDLWACACSPQISSQEEMDSAGCWKDLKLGQIGRSVSLTGDLLDIFSKDLKQLVHSCLRKTSRQTAPTFHL